MIPAMRPLPHVNYVPSRSASLALAWAALALIPLDLGLFLYGEANIIVEPTPWIEFDDMLWSWELRWHPTWVEGLRLGLPWIVPMLLVWTGRIERRDAGLTLGEPRVTLFWIAAPVAVVVLLVATVVALLFAYAFTTQAPWLGVFSQPRALLQRYASPRHLWLTIWDSLVFAPLVEDMLYRGMLAPALERLGGARLALVGSGFAWAGLHLIYQQPVWWMGFYFFCGVFGAWVILKTRSLVAVMALHVLTNLAGIVILDLSRIRSFESTVGLFE